MEQERSRTSYSGTSEQLAVPLLPRCRAVRAARRMSSGAGDGVLVFYKYAPLCAAAGDAVEAALRAECAALALRGRVRVADDGVNAALGGDVGALRRLCAVVAALPQLADGGRAIDFQARSVPAACLPRADQLLCSSRRAVPRAPAPPQPRGSPASACAARASW